MARAPTLCCHLDYIFDCIVYIEKSQLKILIRFNINNVNIDKINKN